MIQNEEAARTHARGREYYCCKPCRENLPSLARLISFGSILKGRTYVCDRACKISTVRRYIFFVCVVVLSGHVVLECVRGIRPYSGTPPWRVTLVVIECPQKHACKIKDTGRNNKMLQADMDVTLHIHRNTAQR